MFFLFFSLTLLIGSIEKNVIDDSHLNIHRAGLRGALINWEPLGRAGILITSDDSLCLSVSRYIRANAKSASLNEWNFLWLIILSYCEEDRYQKQNRNCWNGDHLGDYTHNVMDMHSQKYNPEVPMEQTGTDNENSRLHKINDQLITMKNSLNKQVNKFASFHFSRTLARWPHTREFISMPSRCFGNLIQSVLASEWVSERASGRARGESGKKFAPRKWTN